MIVLMASPMVLAMVVVAVVPASDVATMITGPVTAQIRESDATVGSH